MLICSAPMSCSRQAAEISWTSSAVFLMSGTNRPNISPACWATPSISVDTELISEAARWLRSASLRTSEATTAKPLPCDFLHDADLASDGVHSLYGSYHRLAAQLGIHCRLAGDPFGLSGVISGLLYIGGHLLHRR